MNLKNVLRTYSLLRQLTDDETALLETLRALNDTERELFVEALGPPVKVKGSKAAVKRNIEKCDVVGCDFTKRATIHKNPAADGYHVFTSAPPAAKSKRASSLSQQIQSRSAEKINGICMHGMDGPEGAECGAPPNDPIHDESFGYAGYHPFQSSFPARSVTKQSSSKNDSPTASEASSGTEREDVGDAVHAVSGGD